MVDISNRNAPSAKPPALIRAEISLPDGTTIDTGAVPQCSASDVELDVAGTLACPPSARVGTGTVRADTGFGAPVDPLVGQDNVFNAAHELVEVVTPPGLPLSAAHDRLMIHGDTLTANPPVLPGSPPDGHTSITHLDFTVLATGSTPSPYIRTPSTCPSGDQWVTVARLVFLDGSTSVAAAATPCSPTK